MKKRFELYLSPEEDKRLQRLKETTEAMSLAQVVRDALKVYEITLRASRPRQEAYPVPRRTKHE